MSIFIKKIFIFLLPVIIYVLLIVVIDSFGFFNVLPIINREVKIKSFFRSNKTIMLGNMLWKLNDYKRQPNENIILGDSRANIININDIKELTGDTYYNLAVPGSDFITITELFWYASNQTTLKKVVIALSFQYYPVFSNRKSLFEEASEKINDVYPFFTETLLVQQAYFTMQWQYRYWKSKKRRLYKKENNKENSKTIITKNVINQKAWDKKLSYMNTVYKRYRFPNSNIQELQKIANYCKDNNIQLRFVIFPNNIDLHSILNKHDLGDELNKFKDDIKSVGSLVDFDFENSITLNRENYNDPVHVRKEVYQIINPEIFLDSIQNISRKYN